MSYVVLARKWRPAQFTDIVGQNATIRTLSNAVSSDRIHHAYLFTGSRGVGKTSIARIFSKVLRCVNRKPIAVKDASFLESCDNCSDCKEIASGNSIDVIEIDGASNNGVDNVRDIRESAKFSPSRGDKKIYIIDEVHMLTTAAFNALLKTLEEPPPHIVFIFATTEPHKIPATILSRCQRFDFKRVTTAQMIERLKTIAEKESLSLEAGVLPLIAKAAEGSMRDSLSLLDQVVAYAGDTISSQQAREALGLVENQLIYGILESVLARKAREALEFVDRAYAQGFDLRILARNLLESLHALILLKIGAKPSASFELSDDDHKQLLEISKLRTLEELEMIFQVIHYGIESLARSSQPKIVLDLLLVKCSSAEMLLEISKAAVSTSAAVTSQPRPAAVPSTPAASEVKSWEGLIDFVKGTRPALAALLEHAVPSSFPAATIELRFKTEDSFKRDQVESLYAAVLKELLQKYTGSAVSIKTSVFSPKDATALDSMESLAERKKKEAELKRKQAESLAQNHPIIREAQSLFGAEIGPVEVRDLESGGKE